MTFDTQTVKHLKSNSICKKSDNDFKVKSIQSEVADSQIDPKSIHDKI